MDIGGSIETFIRINRLDTGESAELYSVFLQELDENTRELEKAFAKNDFKAAGKLAHNIKGISASYMIMDVYRIAAAIDTQIKSEDLSDIKSLIEKLLAKVDFSMNEIVNYYRKAGFLLEVIKAV